MVLSPDYEQGKKYPTILRLHGGPEVAVPARLHLMPPVFRGQRLRRGRDQSWGSSGRGEKFSTAIYADSGQQVTCKTCRERKVDYTVSARAMSRSRAPRAFSSLAAEPWRRPHPTPVIADKWQTLRGPVRGGGERAGSADACSRLYGTDPSTSAW